MIVAPKLTMGAVYSPSTSEEISREGVMNTIPPPSNKKIWKPASERELALIATCAATNIPIQGKTASARACTRPVPTRTDIKRKRLTGRDNVKELEPSAPSRSRPPMNNKVTPIVQTKTSVKWTPRSNRNGSSGAALLGTMRTSCTQNTVQPTSAIRNRERVSNQALYQSIA